MAAASAGVLVSTGTQPIKYQRPLEELDVDMPLLTRRHHLGKEGWSPQARKKKKKIMFEVPQAHGSQHSLEHIKMVSFPAGGENEARSRSCWGGKTGGVVRGDIPCPSFVSLDLLSFSRCPHLIVCPERPWINLPFGDCCSCLESALSGGCFIFFYL